MQNSRTTSVAFVRKRRTSVVAGQFIAAATIIVILGVVLRPRTHFPPTPSSRSFPAKINLILDTSASMQGYLSGQTELKDNLAALVSKLDKLRDAKDGIKSIRFEFAQESGTLAPVDYDSRLFIQHLLNNTLLNGKDSLLQDTFREIVAETDKTSLSILITDSIFSYPNKAIRANPNINKDNIAGLAADVQITFNGAKASGDSVALLAARSHFHGAYFDFRNTSRTCCESLRPYYIWLIGEPAYVHTISKYIEEEGLHFDHEVDFDQPQFVPAAAIWQYTSRVGQWYRDKATPNHIEGVRSGAGSDELQFAVALDLSSLPRDKAEIDFLNQHLKVQSSDIKIKSVNLRSRLGSESSLDRKDKDALPSYTHALIIRTDNSFTKTASVEIAIEDAIPSWYQDWSNDDDSRSDAHTLNTTFGLNYFVDAIAGSYRRSDPLFSLTIHLDR